MDGFDIPWRRWRHANPLDMVLKFADFRPRISSRPDRSPISWAADGAPVKKKTARSTRTLIRGIIASAARSNVKHVRGHPLDMTMGARNRRRVYHVGSCPVRFTE